MPQQTIVHDIRFMHFVSVFKNLKKTIDETITFPEDLWVSFFFSALSTVLAYLVFHRSRKELLHYHQRINLNLK